MRHLESIIQDFGHSQHHGLSPRRPFMNQKYSPIHLELDSRRYYA
ncbi:hypothetical protein [Christiangramia oceanisediminis]|nr:hypothetical protein [Gramella oceanisediminis]